MCAVHGWDAPCKCGYAIAAAFIVAGCALFRDAPDTAARDAHRAELVACRAYDLLPAEKHTPSGDKLCRSARLVCAEPDAGGAGN